MRVFMIVGYARTSTIEQIAGFESQLLALKKQVAKKIYQRASVIRW